MKRKLFILFIFIFITFDFYNITEAKAEPLKWENTDKILIINKTEETEHFVIIYNSSATTDIILISPDSRIIQNNEDECKIRYGKTGSRNYNYISLYITGSTGAYKLSLKTDNCSDLLIGKTDITEYTTANDLKKPETILAYMGNLEELSDAPFVISNKPVALATPTPTPTPVPTVFTQITPYIDIIMLGLTVITVCIFVVVFIHKKNVKARKKKEKEKRDAEHIQSRKEMLQKRNDEFNSLFTKNDDEYIDYDTVYNNDYMIDDSHEIKTDTKNTEIKPEIKKIIF